MLNKIGKNAYTWLVDNIRKKVLSFLSLSKMLAVGVFVDFFLSGLGSSLLFLVIRELLS